MNLTLLALKTKHLLLILCSIFLLSACQKNNVYDFVKATPGKGFGYADSLDFKVQINDTTSHYNMYVNVRHLAAYPYSNLWIRLSTTYPNGSHDTKDLSLPLANDEGKWYGVAIADVVNQKILVQPNASLSQGGVYTFNIMQNSRDSLLQDLLELGVRLERIKAL
jgi:gliding motility-associated lipoprotein GldH